MFKPGDEIKSLKTGIKTTGTVIQTMSAVDYCKNRQDIDFNHWDELYPDWKEKNVVIVQYNKPKRTVNLKQIMERCKNPPYVAQVIYTMLAAYPEDDLRIRNA